MTDDNHFDLASDHEDDTAYFQRRAEWHRHRADVAHDDSTRTLHRKFATLYQARAQR